MIFVYARVVSQILGFLLPTLSVLFARSHNEIALLIRNSELDFKCSFVIFICYFL